MPSPMTINHWLEYGNHTLSEVLKEFFEKEK